MIMTNLRKLARGKSCMVRLPGICNHDPATTVLAHYRLGGTCGAGMKPSDWQGAWACSACHDAVDGRTEPYLDNTMRRLSHAEGVLRTQHAIREMVKRGEIDGAKLNLPI